MLQQFIAAMAGGMATNQVPSMNTPQMGMNTIGCCCCVVAAVLVLFMCFDLCTTYISALCPAGNNPMQSSSGFGVSNQASGAGMSAYDTMAQAYSGMQQFNG